MAPPCRLLLRERARAHAAMLLLICHVFTYAMLRASARYYARECAARRRDISSVTMLSGFTRYGARARAHALFTRFMLLRVDAIIVFICARDAERFIIPRRYTRACCHAEDNIMRAAPRYTRCRRMPRATQDVLLRGDGALRF